MMHCKIAVACENNQVFQHFGRTPEFAVFEISEERKIVDESRLSTGETGHGALAALLDEQGIACLICGGIGGGAIQALSDAGIQVIPGAEGDVHDVVEAVLNGTFVPCEGFVCNHHHGEGGHSCGDHGCGSHGCHH